MEYRRSRPVSLKAHETYNERWLQAQIEEDPGLLGLGDLIVKDIERRQPRAGRLDLLLSDPETHTRYEVEIQLGATDESHIIRTIEYWDIEKSRYPQYEHVAVIVAEDITSRFLNVINLFNKAIPLIAIQLRALDVGGVLTINATTVLDLMQVGTEEEDEPGQATDRDFWINNGSAAFVAVADQILALINEVTPVMTLKYNKRYTGLVRDGIVDNFVVFRPRRDSTIVGFRIPRSDEASALVDGSGVDSLEYDKRRGRYRLRVTAEDLTAHRNLLLELVRRASKTPPPGEE
jgi:hypothetical protein